MCRPVTCKSCHKTTWAGCGQHIDQVKATVPAGQWCECKPAAAPAAGRSGSFISRLFGN